MGERACGVLAKWRWIDSTEYAHLYGQFSSLSVSCVIIAYLHVCRQIDRGCSERWFVSVTDSLHENE